MDSPSSPPAAQATAPARFRWGPYTSVFLLLFLFGTETFLVSPLLPTIADDLGISEQSAAYSVTAYVLVYAVCAPFLGLVSDRVGRRRTLLIGSVLFLLSNVAAALSDGLTLLVLSRALAGLAAAAAGPAIWAHIAETTEDTVRGRALGMGMALFSCGQVLGVPLGSFLADAAGWRAAFWAMAAGTLLVVPVLLKQIPISAAQAAGGLGIGAVFAAWGHPALRKALLVNTAFNAANLGAYTFMGVVLADRFDLSVSALGLVGILVGIGSVVGSTVGGRLGDRARAQGRTHLPMLPVWGLLLAAGVALTVWGPGLILTLVGVALWFLASGGFVTDQQTLAGTAAPELRATSSAWLTSTMYAGTGVGAWAIGLFSDLSLATAVVGIGLALVASLGGVLVSTQLRRDTDRGPLVDAASVPKKA
ncbi:MFS transporter [Streptomyces sp. TRM76323]|uniref:MFS transporter n=1 Tax=Streptomyces tamarix TaxID=3078565 RepID=A0ABU3QV33_9ACTN|nr:MFS transporter [Streptomyces tamarix]MDT9686622.1 MFS transporter [Streptomyces tamarix]